MRSGRRRAVMGAGLCAVVVMQGCATHVGGRQYDHADVVSSVVGTVAAVGAFAFMMVFGAAEGASAADVPGSNRTLKTYSMDRSFYDPYVY